MALASCVEARSVIELSLSPLYHYQFSSITRAIDALADDDFERLRVEEDIIRLCLPKQTRYLLQTDTTPLCKPHSPTLAERTYVHTAGNTVAGNRPLNVGYEVSFINLSLPEWSLPLSARRVGPNQTASDCALEQLNDLVPHLGDDLLVNTLDSKYGNAAYMARVHYHANLVSVVRLRAGMKVYPPAEPCSTGGAPRVYGQCHYLLLQSRHKTYKHPRTKLPHEVFQTAIFEQPPDEYLTMRATTRRGRVLTVHLWRYNNWLVRTKDGHSMKDKPFDILIAKVCDGNKTVFKHPLFIAISGARKSELSTEDIYLSYRRRYDIEPYFRFAKQRLLLEGYQSPDRQHIENWLLIVQLASWLLYTASDEVHFRARKWERASRQHNHERESIARTRRAAQRLFLTFDPSLFKPTRCKKGKGRPLGFKLEMRKRHKVCKKATKKASPVRKYQKIR